MDNSAFEWVVWSIGVGLMLAANLTVLPSILTLVGGGVRGAAKGRS